MPRSYDKLPNVPKNTYIGLFIPCIKTILKKYVNKQNMDVNIKRMQTAKYVFLRADSSKECVTFARYYDRQIGILRFYIPISRN
jgi:hypothetical protein